MAGTWGHICRLTVFCPIGRLRFKIKKSSLGQKCFLYSMHKPGSELTQFLALKSEKKNRKLSTAYKKKNCTCTHRFDN
jgi:hypothetical protein